MKVVCYQLKALVIEAGVALDLYVEEPVILRYTESQETGICDYKEKKECSGKFLFSFRQCMVVTEDTEVMSSLFFSVDEIHNPCMNFNMLKSIWSSQLYYQFLHIYKTYRGT